MDIGEHEMKLLDELARDCKNWTWKRELNCHPDALIEIRDRIARLAQGLMLHSTYFKRSTNG